MISEFVPKFEVRMRLPSLYRMSEDEVHHREYIPLLSSVEFECDRFRSDFWGSRRLVVALEVSWCGPSELKLVYRISEFVPKFEFRMRLPSFIG